jgi:hypothetical protein
LPTCVGLGTGTTRLPRGFSRRHGFRNFAFAGSASRLRLNARRICLPDVLRGYPKSTNAWVSLAYPVPPSVITTGTWYRNINRLSIAYAFRPRLRSRLTLSRLALLRNPWAFGGEVSHFSFVTRASILTSQRSTTAYANASQHWERSPTTPSCDEVRGFGFQLEPRYIVRARPLDQ